MSDAVGLLVGVYKNKQNAVVLQTRSSSEKSYPGASQVTLHGRLNEDERQMPGLEGYATALRRELREELGSVIGAVIDSIIEKSPEALILLSEQILPGKTVRTFGLCSDLSYEHFIEMMVPCSEVGGVRACTNPDTIEALDPALHRKNGVPEKEVRMFADEIEAVKKAFSCLFPNTNGQPSDKKKEA